jgi:hypothetical protein
MATMAMATMAMATSTTEMRRLAVPGAAGGAALPLGGAESLGLMARQPVLMKLADLSVAAAPAELPQATGRPHGS